MKRSTIITAAAVTTLLVGGLIGGVAAASAGGDDVDTPITGDALDTASQVALDHVGEGRVTDTEVGDEESLYEVEVRLDDGTEIDVQLDENFDVVGDSADVPDEPDTD